MSTEIPQDIEALLPHRPPMRLVQKVAALDEYRIETVSVASDSWPTAEGGHIRSLLLIELIAQSAAALQGWRERDKGPGKGGLLVGVRDSRFNRSRIPVGARLHCHVTISHGVESYCAFDGRVTDEMGEEIMTASVQAYRP
jgi:predicted hotdog family 3-hydroxylacyl-ACP dehydratase